MTVSLYFRKQRTRQSLGPLKGAVSVQKVFFYKKQTGKKRDEWYQTWDPCRVFLNVWLDVESVVVFTKPLTKVVKVTRLKLGQRPRSRQRVRQKVRLPAADFLCFNVK